MGGGKIKNLIIRIFFINAFLLAASNAYAHCDTLDGPVVKDAKTALEKTLRHKDESVEAGREYVEAYVDFMHYVEKLYNVSSKPAGHYGEEMGGHNGD